MSTKILAHRGASGYAPENTLYAFKKAISMNSDGIELDVHLTKDEKIVVIHDEKLNRTTNGSGLIKDFSLSELKKLDAGSWYNPKYKNEKIPTLEEVFNLVKDKNIIINIELKNGIIEYTGLEEKVLELIHKYKIEENIIISSFNHYSLLKVKSLNSKIKTGILYVASLINPWIYAKNISAYSLNPYFYSVDKNLVINCKKNNINVIPYTVNDEEYIYKLIKSNIYSIITNYPDKAISIRNNLLNINTRG